MRPEADVKKEIKALLDAYGAFHFMYVPTGFGKKGIHDHIACVPLTITQQHVGATIGIFVSIEAKRYGKHMTPHQKVIAKEVLAARGIAIEVAGTSNEPGSFGRFKEVMKRVFGIAKST